MAKTRRCRVCRNYKDPIDFYPDNTSRDGLQPKCMTCSSRMNRLDYSKNQEKYQARGKVNYYKRMITKNNGGELGNADAIVANLSAQFPEYAEWEVWKLVANKFKMMRVEEDEAFRVMAVLATKIDSTPFDPPAAPAVVMPWDDASLDVEDSFETRPAGDINEI